MPTTLTITANQSAIDLPFLDVQSAAAYAALTFNLGTQLERLLMQGSPVTIGAFTLQVGKGGDAPS